MIRRQLKFKKLFLMMTFLLSLFSFAQDNSLAIQNVSSTPNLINYQGVLRDASSNLIANTPIILAISLTTNTSGSGVVYSEHLTTSTNAYGMFNIQYGDGGDIYTSGDFSSVDWGNGTYYLHISYKLASDPGDFIALGYSNQLVAVPYALHAKTAENLVGGGITETDPVFVASPSYVITTTDIDNWNTPSWTKTATTVYTDKMVGIGTITPTTSLEIVDANLSDTKQTVVNIIAENSVGGTGFNEALSVDLNSTTVSNAGANGVYSLSHGVNTGRNRGVVGEAYGSTFENAGVYGLSRGVQGTSVGVRGTATGANTNSNYGMIGYADNATGNNIGVYGRALHTAASGFNFGIYGISNGTTSRTNYGISGNALNSSTLNIAIDANASQTTSGNNVGLQSFVAQGAVDNTAVDATSYGGGSGLNIGLRAEASGPTGLNIGVYAEAGVPGPNNYAGYFAGDVTVTGNLDVQGNLSKAGGTFKIDHPEDPANKYLVHSFVESPEMMNVYNGNIKTDSNGFSTVELPAYFEKVNKDFRYQLTVIGTFAQAIIKEKISNNRFVIQTNQPNVEVSWQVTGIRADKWANANRVVPELEKKEKGIYIHPELYGQPKENKEKYIAPSKSKKVELKPILTDGGN